VRVASAPDGSLRTGPGQGRGAWLCAGSLDCFERALRRGALAYALRRPLTTAEVEVVRAMLLGQVE
jgi:predicted RNA-binding protein YlxR (DUF448 family)